MRSPGKPAPPQEETGYKPIVHTPQTRLEIVVGLTWLSLAMIISALMEVLYLTVRVNLPDGHSVPIPLTIVIAFGFNMVVSRTAKLWSKKFYVAAIPTLFWLLGYASLIVATISGSGVYLADSPLVLVLLIAGVTGAYVPLKQMK